MSRKLSTLRANGAEKQRLFWAAINAIAAADYEPEANNAPNIITAINAAIITEGNFRQGLTTFAVGWRDEENVLDADNEFFGPSVRTSERFSYKQADNAEAFYSETADDLRAARSEFKQVETKMSEVDASTKNRGLQIVIDRKELDLHGAEHFVGKLMRRLKRNKLRRKFALLSAGANNTAKTWDGTAGVNPDNEIMTELITAGNLSGVHPNRVGFGLTSWQKRFSNLDAQTAPALAARAGYSPDQLAALLGVDKVHVSKTRYTSSATARTQIVANLVLMFTAMAEADTEDASNIKDFWSPCEMGGGQYAVHQWDIGAKMVGIAVEHYELIKLTSTLGIRQLTIG